MVGRSVGRRGVRRQRALSDGGRGTADSWKFLLLFRTALVIFRCTPDQWACLNGQCIAASARCDNVNDCPEGEDEMVCGQEEEIDDGKLDRIV